MQKRHVVAFDPATGQARAGADVKVFITGTANLISLFADDEVTPLTNPLSTDAMGRTSFKAADGDYDIEVSGAGFTTYKLVDVQVADKDNFAPAAGPPPATPDMIPTGAIMAFGGAVAPSGWVLCNGAAISRGVYAALFAVIGTTYGVGDGATTFNLPNFKGRAPVGEDSGQVEFTPLGKADGANTHTLDTTEIPSHTHPLYGGMLVAEGASHPIGTGAVGWTVANVSPALYIAQATGGGGAHNNLQPYLAVNFIIKT